MSNGYNNFDNTDALRNSPAIKERVSLISSLMYKQFCDYQHSSENGSEIFNNLIQASHAYIDLVKQSFASRGVATENIWVKVDGSIPVVVINIFWNTYSFTMKCNFKPQALHRENEMPVISSRIMAIKGDYFKIINTKDADEIMGLLLEHELASLFVPENKMHNAILKAKHRANKEFQLTQTDAGREFLMLVSELVCGDPIYHEEGSRKSFNI